MRERERKRHSIEGHEIAILDDDIIYFLAHAHIHADNMDIFLLTTLLFLTSVVASVFDGSFMHERVLV